MISMFGNPRKLVKLEHDIVRLSCRACGKTIPTANRARVRGFGIWKRVGHNLNQLSGHGGIHVFCEPCATEIVDDQKKVSPDTTLVVREVHLSITLFAAQKGDRVKPKRERKLICVT